MGRRGFQIVLASLTLAIVAFLIVLSLTQRTMAVRTEGEGAEPAAATGSLSSAALHPAPLSM